MAIKYYPEHLPPTTEHLIWGGDINQITHADMQDLFYKHGTILATTMCYMQ